VNDVTLDAAQVFGAVVLIVIVTLVLCALVRLWLGARKNAKRSRNKLQDLVYQHDSVLFGRNQRAFSPRENKDAGIKYRLERLEKELGIEPWEEPIW
jgi:Mg2+/citrate symporter